MTHWNFEYAGKLYDMEAESEDALIKSAERWWGEQCREEGGLRNGETYTAEITAIERDPDTDEEKQRKLLTIDYEHYHGDLAEHGLGYHELA